MPLDPLEPDPLYLLARLLVWADVPDSDALVLVGMCEEDDG